MTLDRVRTLSRRAAITALTGSALGFAVLGPRPARQSSDGRITLDYWEKWTGHEGDAMRRVVDDFNRSQDRIRVRYFTMSAIDQKALIAIAGGDPPDIVGLWGFNIPAYAESGAIIPLDELASEFGVTADRYTAPVWQLMRHQGRMFGVVNTCGTIALYYNKTLFREVGLDPQRPPRTIEEFDDVNRRLTRVDGRGRIERIGFLHTEPGWWSWLWGAPFGGSVFDEASDRATADSPANVRGYRWAQGWPQRYGVDALVAFQSGLGFYNTAENAFISGKVAMVNQGPWLANVVNAYRPDLDYGVAPFPVAAELHEPDRPIGMLDADVLVVPRGVRHPRECFEFIAYTQRQEVVEYLSTAHGKNSPLARSSEQFRRNHPNRAIDVHERLAASERAFRFPATRTWPEYVSIFNSAFEQMWRLESPAEKVLAQVQARAQAAIDRAAEMRRRRLQDRERGATA